MSARPRCPTARGPQRLIHRCHTTRYCQHGSLLAFLRKRASSADPALQLGLPQRLQFSLEIARGMAHMSARGIVHRDLAARNVLVDATLTCKVADFGLSRRIHRDYYKTSGGALPVRWTAIEVIQFGERRCKPLPRVPEASNCPLAACITLENNKHHPQRLHERMLGSARSLLLCLTHSVAARTTPDVAGSARRRTSGAMAFCSTSCLPTAQRRTTACQTWWL